MSCRSALRIAGIESAIIQPALITLSVITIIIIITTTLLSVFPFKLKHFSQSEKIVRCVSVK